MFSKSSKNICGYTTKQGYNLVIINENIQFYSKNIRNYSSLERQLLNTDYLTNTEHYNRPYELLRKFNISQCLDYYIH